MAIDENGRQAAALRTSISSYVGTATLAVIGGGVALFTYIQQSFAPPGLFYVCMALGAGLLVISFILGGRGASSTAAALADGTWSIATSKPAFNWQAILTLLGLLAVMAAAGLGTTAPVRVVRDPCVAVLSSDLSRSPVEGRQLRRDLATCEAPGNR